MPEPAAQGDRARRLNEARAGGAPAVEPTLPELLRDGWRRAGAAGRAAMIAAAVLLVALVAWLLLGRGGGSFSYDGPDAPPFSISWTELERVDPVGDELLRLESGDSELAIAPLRFDQHADEPLPELALDASSASDAPATLEGRTLLAVDRGPEAYQLAYSQPAGEGEITVRKRLLVPDPDRPGTGVRIEIAETVDDPRVAEKVAEAPAGFFLNWPIQLLLEDAASVRTEEGLEEPLRSFSFG